MLLHHEVLSADGATPTRSILFLHGILGQGSNLRSMARKFVTARPEWQAVLLDLRAHGDSQGVEGADTVAACAADVAQTCRAFPAVVHAVVGHSFGGKVALALGQAHPTLSDVMTLDSAPGARLDARGSESTLRVVEMLDGMQGPWSKRDDFVAEVEAAGQNKGLAQWLAMNLEKRDEGFVLRLSLPRIHALLDDYFAVDLWPVVERSAVDQKSPRFHLVVATRSKVYSEEDRARARALEAKSGGFVTVDTIEAGHWLHVEQPQAVFDAVLRRLG